jgi:hypothetical protein
MTLTIELDPEEEVRLATAAKQEGLAPAALARRLVVEHLPSVTGNGEAQVAGDAKASQAAGVCSKADDAEDVLDWDAWTSTPPRRRTGTIRAKLQHAGRARPMPADAPWAE